MSYPGELFDLTGMSAVVIGGTGVLCGQMALALARAGAKVIVAGRDHAKGAAKVDAITAAGGKASFLPVDVLASDSIQRLFDATKSIGPVDILINGAGVNSATPYFEISAQEWDRILTANLRGVHEACQLFGNHMVERKRGSIINVASISASVGLSRVFAYSASKAALVNYTQNLAREFGPTGVRVNCISPGFFPAEQNRAILDKTRVASILARTPMNRFGEPAELDGVVLLLASTTAGAFITGANFVVDGGFSSMAI